MDSTDTKYKEVRAFANYGDRSRHDAQGRPEKKRRLDNEDSQQLGGGIGNAINTNTTLAAMLGPQYHHHNQKAVDGDAVSSPGFESIRK